MKKTILYKIILGLVVVANFIACRKYVEIESYTSRTLKYTDDYQYLMNNRTIFESSYVLPMVTSDDVETDNAGNQATWNPEMQNAYVWAENYYSDTQSDLGWNGAYKQIYTCNEVIAGIMDSERGTEEQKKTVYAEALVQRAYAYLLLVNQYAPIYNSQTAASQKGVPLLLTPDLYQSLERATLQQVYDQITKDVQEAIPSLLDYASTNAHPSKGAAYALLARCYLYMREFDKAGEYASKALELNSTLLDLSTYVGKLADLPTRLNDPEIILSKNHSGYFQAKLNEELLALYDNTDLRYSLFTIENNSLGGRVYNRHMLGEGYIYTGLTVPEMMLTLAEAHARKGEKIQAVELLNTLRSKRYNSADYVALDVDNVSDILSVVIAERRRELAGRGLRWFDMRRLTLDAAFAKNIMRVFKDQTYTLEPTSDRYIYPVAPSVLELNPEIGIRP